MNDTTFTPLQVEILAYITRYTLIGAYQDYKSKDVDEVCVKLGLKRYGKEKL